MENQPYPIPTQTYYHNFVYPNEVMPVYYNTNQRNFCASNNQSSLYAGNTTVTNNQPMDSQIDFQNEIIPEESIPNYVDKNVCLNRLYVSGALLIFFSVIVLILKYFGKI